LNPLKVHHKNIITQLKHVLFYIELLEKSDEYSLIYLLLFRFHSFTTQWKLDWEDPRRKTLEIFVNMTRSSRHHKDTKLLFLYQMYLHRVFTNNNEKMIIEELMIDIFKRCYPKREDTTISCEMVIEYCKKHFHKND